MTQDFRETGIFIPNMVDSWRRFQQFLFIPDEAFRHIMGNGIAAFFKRYSLKSIFCEMLREYLPKLKSLFKSPFPAVEDIKNGSGNFAKIRTQGMFRMVVITCRMYIYMKLLRFVHNYLYDNHDHEQMDDEQMDAFHDHITAPMETRVRKILGHCLLKLDRVLTTKIRKDKKSAGRQANNNFASLLPATTNTPTLPILPDFGVSVSIPIKSYEQLDLVGQFLRENRFFDDE